MKNKLVAVLFIVVFVLLVAVICSLLNDDSGLSNIDDVRLPAVETDSAAAVTPTPAPENTEPTPTATLLPLPSATPEPTPEPTPTPVLTPTPVPAGLDLGSGSFSSENQVPLNIIADWTAKTVDSNTVSVTVTVSAQSYSLHLEPTKSLHISLNGEYKTVDVAALTYDGTDLAKNELGSATFDIDLPAGSSNSYTLAVEWQFGGFYFNTPIEVLECGGTISLSR